MTVGIDIRFLARGSRTGIEEYTLNLLSRLLPLGKEIKFKLFYNAYHKEALNFDWLKLPNVELYEFGLPNRFVFDPLAKFFKRPKVDKLIGGADVFFCPHFLLTPLSDDCQKVLTFHDLSFEFFPEFFPRRKRFWHWFLSPRARANEAEKIIAISNSTKNDLTSRFGIGKEKIKVIHSGIGHEFRRIQSDEHSALVRQKYHLPEKFILYFGTIEPRKNVDGLIRAFELFRDKNPAGPSLVIAGNLGWLYGRILKAVNQSPWRNEIHLTGFVEPADKIYLYNLAGLFVYPSYFEGFGFPPLEAMACGVPVICSHTAPFGEIVGEAALMVDPYNREEVAWAINEMWRDESLRRDYIKSGFERVKRFSWDKCAQETLTLIKSLYENRH